MGILTRLGKLFEIDGYSYSGEMPSERPYQILESEENVRVSEDYYTGEAAGEQDFGIMNGEDAAELLREFDIAEDSNYPGAGEAGFSHETYDEDSNFGPDFDSWDSYRIRLDEDGTGKIEVKSLDFIMGFFPRYTSLEFEF